MRPRSIAPDGALTSGCVFVLVLVADVTAAMLVLIVLALRGLGRMDLPGGTAEGAPAVDWVPVFCYVGFALAAALAGVLLVRGGNRLTGAVQLALAVLVASAAVGVWHDARDRSRAPATSPADRLVDASRASVAVLAPDASEVVLQPAHRQTALLDPAQQPGRAFAQAGTVQVVVVRGDQEDVAGP